MTIQIETYLPRIQRLMDDALLRYFCNFSGSQVNIKFTSKMMLNCSTKCMVRLDKNGPFPTAI